MGLTFEELTGMSKEEWEATQVKSKLQKELEEECWEFVGNYESMQFGGEKLKEYYGRTNPGMDVLLTEAYSYGGELLPDPNVAVYLREF